jgi:AcrR family transcriptional regulator
MRYSLADWLEQGLAALSENGIEALTIDAMCARLNVTKGSFYHHFTNREAFLEALLQHWEAHYTQDFITYSQAGQTPSERLARLNQRVIETFGTSEVAIRVWAQGDPLAQAYLERVDQQRIEYLYQQYIALTGDESYSRTMSRMVYAILIGAETVMPTYTRDDLQAMYDLLQQLINHTKRR